MIIGDLFAGIGGFSLAAHWMGWRTAWFSEVNPYASAVLRKHWPHVPNHGDITKLKGADVERVDMLCGGFPCQDISFAGKGAGIEGERSGLWSHYARLIDELRPCWIVAENVSALRKRGLDRVLTDLCALGYDAEWHCIPASGVGAPHERDRIWIVAYPHGEQEHSVFAGCWPDGSCASAPAWAVDLMDAGMCAGDARGSEVAHRNCAGLERHTRYGGAAEWQATSGSTAARCVCGREDCGGWWASEPDVGRVAHGIPSRVDRLVALGNAIVPQLALRIFQQIAISTS